MFHEGVSPVLPIILEKAVEKEANRTMNPSFHTVGWEGLHLRQVQFAIPRSSAFLLQTSDVFLHDVSHKLCVNADVWISIGASRPD